MRTSGRGRGGSLNWDPRLSPRPSGGRRGPGFDVGGLLGRGPVIIGGILVLVVLLLAFLASRGGDEVSTDLRSEVESALVRAGYTGIDVAVDDRVVSLAGQVATDADAVAVTSVARSVPDVLSVNGDRLEATEPTPVARQVEATSAELELQAELSGLVARDPIQFASGSAEIVPESLTTLDQIAALVAEVPEVSILIAGHTDADGEEAANQQLSEDRAGAVSDYLVSVGVAAERLSTVGFGESAPIASNDTQEGKERNRRIEFLVQPAGE